MTPDNSYEENIDRPYRPEKSSELVEDGDYPDSYPGENDFDTDYDDDNYHRSRYNWKWMPYNHKPITTRTTTTTTRAPTNEQTVYKFEHLPYETKHR